MVERQLRRRGIDDERVLAAMASVPREHFVAERLRGRAYEDSALPIAEQQTISQPWVVAAICQALKLEGTETVLEVGTGSGYSTAVLACLAGEVVSVERFASLADEASRRLAELGFDKVEIRAGDGTKGVPERAPYEAIAVHATAPCPPRTLLQQLVPGGRLVAPVAERDSDMLSVFERGTAGFERRDIAPCRFVPLLGDEGFAPPEGTAP